MLSECSLGFSLQFDFILRDFLIKHVATVLRIDLHLLFHLSEFLLVLTFLLLLKLNQLFVKLLLQLTFLCLKTSVNFSTQNLQLLIVLCLYLALLNFQSVDINTFGVEHLVLFVPELLNLKIESLLLALFHCASNAFVAAHQ